MSTIPASAFVNVTPNVLVAGGDALDLIGLMLTTSNRVPIGEVLSFASAPDVQDYFGAESDEDESATIYFNGFDGSTVKPGAVLFAQYPADAVAAYIRGGDISQLTLTQLQAIIGSLDIVIDGVARNAASVNLSTATGFSSGAGIIQTALNAASPAAASVTASIGGVVTASAGAAFTGDGSGTNLTTSSVTGVIHIGAAIAGAGVPSGTYIVSQTSGSTGGAGVYVTNHATTSSSDALIASSNILDVTGLTSGTLHATDAISGTGVASGTTVLAQSSGTPGGVGLYTIGSQQHFASATVTALSTVLNVTAVGSGAVELGAVLTGTNVTSGTTVTAEGTGTGGTGTYVVDRASTTISETITATAANVAVTYDSVSGAYIITSGITGVLSTAAFATGTTAAALKLTSATGAVLSQGAAAATPAAFMDDVIATTQDWVSFMTIFDPDDSGNTNKLAFSAWTNDQNKRYAYVCWDTDVTPSESSSAAGSMGHIIGALGNNGTFMIGRDANGVVDQTYAAFVCGIGASIDTNELNGRTDYDFRAQAGLAATCTDETAMNNLIANGYNSYVAVATANQGFTFLTPGSVSGEFLWMDSYIDQIWLNNAFQLALMTLLTQQKSIPYNPAGFALIEAACNDPINAALNFGAIRAGVTLSASQAAAVNTAAGVRISDTLTTRGWYLQVKDPGALVRQARDSTVNNFWYTDGQSVQKINLNSIELT